jgi:hypothetical protein
MHNTTEIVAFCLAVIAAFWTYIAWPFVKARTSLAQQEKLLSLVRTAVYAMEQTMRDPKSGRAKLSGAIEWLRKRGITVDTEQLRGMIEAEVFKMNAEIKVGGRDA